jgi:hypothetical protein
MFRKIRFRHALTAAALAATATGAIALAAEPLSRSARPR